MNLINTCRNISLHSEEILFNWQQEILYRFAIDWRCPFLDAIASPSTYPCQSVSEWVSQWVIVSDLEIAIASPSFASLLLQIRYNILSFYFSKKIYSQSQGLRREREFSSLNIRVRDENEIFFSTSQGLRQE